MTSFSLDLGGTRIKLGIVRGGTVLAQSAIDADSRAGLRGRLDAIGQALRVQCEQTDTRVADVDGIGFAFPCIIEPRTGRVLSGIDKYPDAGQIDLHEWARRTFHPGINVAVDNDANAALAGEWQFGAGRGTRSCVIMTLGTGIGTSAVIDGAPLRGEHGQAGCLGGHVVVNAFGRKCVCGNIGCVEAEASTWALPALAREDQRFEQSPLAREPVIDYAAVFRLAEQGDDLSRDLRDRAITVWSAAAVNLVHAYDPEVVILAGGIMKGGELIAQRMQAHLDVHAWVGWGKVRVVKGELGDGAALLGMSWLADKERSR